MNPPIRSERHKIAAWEAIANGTVDVVGSDHIASFEVRQGKTLAPNLCRPGTVSRPSFLLCSITCRLDAFHVLA
jgi:dihydroorotase-like cyclic amidohydrolase